jgi:aerotaxis receptor
MRKNLPVIQQEYSLEPGAAIISRTDLKGRIVSCNDEFVLASGFERAELIGQPHNIVRHPDMPEEAFRDLWQTIVSQASVERHRQEPAQEWRLLLGEGHRHPPFRWLRLHVGARPGKPR